MWCGLYKDKKHQRKILDVLDKKSGMLGAIFKMARLFPIPDLHRYVFVYKSSG